MSRKDILTGIVSSLLASVIWIFLEKAFHFDYAAWLGPAPVAKTVTVPTVSGAPVPDTLPLPPVPEPPADTAGKPATDPVSIPDPAHPAYQEEEGDGFVTRLQKRVARTQLEATQLEKIGGSFLGFLPFIMLILFYGKIERSEEGAAGCLFMALIPIVFIFEVSVFLSSSPSPVLLYAVYSGIGSIVVISFLFFIYICYRFMRWFI